MAADDRFCGHPIRLDRDPYLDRLPDTYVVGVLKDPGMRSMSELCALLEQQTPVGGV